MKSNLSLVVLAFLFLQNLVFAQGRILLEGATIHVGNGEVIPTGLLGIENGKIILIKNALSTEYSKSDWDTVVNVYGQHLYPGFMAPNSTLGLVEIESVRASVDAYELGVMNPHVRSVIAYNCESKVIATVKTNGVLFTQPTPKAGFITGASSILHTDCWNWEDGLVKENDGIHIQWPFPYSYGEEGIKNSGNYHEEIAKLSQFFKESIAYGKSEKKVPDLRYEAISNAINNNQRFYFHAEEIQQLLDVIDFVRQFELKFPVIIGGYDAPLVAEQLNSSKISIMLPRLHSLPAREGDPTNYVYTLPSKLQTANVKFCLQNEGDMDAMNARNIPFLAGTAMAYGLTEEQAIQSVSLSACEIVGIADRYGSIEVGKMASLFVSKGNALDMRTNDVSLILMNGEFKSVTNEQTALFLKYKKKFGLKN